MFVTALRSLVPRIHKSVYFMFPLQDKAGGQGFSAHFTFPPLNVAGGQGDGLVSQGLGAQAWGPEFEPQDLSKCQVWQCPWGMGVHGDR